MQYHGDTKALNFVSSRAKFLDGNGRGIHVSPNIEACQYDVTETSIDQTRVRLLEHPGGVDAVSGERFDCGAL